MRGRRVTILLWNEDENRAYFSEDIIEEFDLDPDAKYNLDENDNVIVEGTGTIVYTRPSLLKRNDGITLENDNFNNEAQVYRGDPDDTSTTNANKTEAIRIELGGESNPNR